MAIAANRPGFYEAQEAALTGTGGGMLLEDYVRQLPQMPAPSLDLVGQEYLVRRLFGDRPKPAQYLSRFPQHAAGLPAEDEDLLELIAATIVSCPGCDAALLQRCFAEPGPHQTPAFRYGPGSATHHAAKGGAVARRRRA